MRTREMGYSDYGFDGKEEKRLKEYCRNKTFNDYDAFLLMQSAVAANPDLANDMYYSLVNGISYDKISVVKYIPISKSDFYGYQRKCLAIFRNFLIMCGKWR